MLARVNGDTVTDTDAAHGQQVNTGRWRMQGEKREFRMKYILFIQWKNGDQTPQERQESTRTVSQVCIDKISLSS